MGKNKLTVTTYNDEYQVYLDKTASVVSGTLQVFIDHFLSHIDKDSEILEIGSGGGRDASYIEKQGYKNILRSDAAKNFVEYLRAKGSEAIVLDIVEERLDRTFDAVFADGVFLHFDKSEFKKAMNNTLAMLRADGILAIALQEGTYRGVSDHKLSARYFREWQRGEILEFLKQFDVEVLENLKGVSLSGRKNWIHLILRKR